MFETIKEILSDQLGIACDMIDEDSSLFRDLGADSLDIVEIVMALESAFAITIPESVYDSLSDVKSISDYIRARLDEPEEQQ